MQQRKPWGLYGAMTLLAGLVVLLAWINRDRMTPVVEGGPAPDFLAYDMEGKRTSLEDYRGRVVLLNLWATWCTPCKKEMPSLQRLFEDVHDEDFAILAVSVDRERPEQDRTKPLGGKLQAFGDSLGLTFTILHDPSGAISTLYQTTGVPESFIIDREGVIAKRVTGPLEWDAPANAELIGRLLSGGAPGAR